VLYRENKKKFGHRAEKQVSKDKNNQENYKSENITFEKITRCLEGLTKRQKAFATQ